MKTKWFVSVLFISLSTLMYAQSPFGYIKGMFRVGDVEVGCISKEGDTIIDPLLVKYLANGNGFVLASSETYGFSESYPGYIDTNGTFFPHKYRISVPPYKGKALGIRNDKLFLLDASGTEKEICDA
ncbi:MAG: hypothetical protein KKA07_17105, partial [Bacteroidetes bacterium]|nr:hypothetical protein [Bacteroidota bacterium]